MVSSSSHVGSGIVCVDGVGQISCSHCLYHASLFCSITCILFHQSIFLHLILYLLFPHLFRSSSCSTRYATTAHFKFQSLHYHIFIYDRGYHRMLFALAILSKDPVMPNMSINFSLFLRSKSFTPHIARIIALFVLLRTAISFSLAMVASLYSKYVFQCNDFVVLQCNVSLRFS